MAGKDSRWGSRPQLLRGCSGPLFRRGAPPNRPLSTGVTPSLNVRFNATKVKEELEYIPAQLKVLEYWQEKAVFEQGGQEHIVAAPRSAHPLGKCIATPSLRAYLITSKYADGLPLYRQEQMLKRLGHEVSRTSMAHWIIRLNDVFKPLMTLMRETQNGSNYLQADETRIQVLKEIFLQR